MYTAQLLQARYVSGRDWDVSVQASCHPLSTHAQIFVWQSSSAVVDSLPILITSVMA